MKIDRRYTQAGRSPYADIEFTTRKSEIREPDGTVGLGLCKEVADARALDLPVVFLDDEGGAFDAFELVPHDARSARRFARVVAG